MLEAVFERLKLCREKQLERQFELEDLYREILFEGRNLNDEQIKQRRIFLDNKVKQRKNLYIYPEQVNV